MMVRTAAAALVATLAFGACGGEDDPASSSSGGATDQERRDAAVAFAECMREQGVDMPDPKFDESGRMSIQIPPGQDREAVEAAQEECQQHLAAAGGGGEPSEAERAEMRERVLAFAECMREHGVDFPDPQFSEGGGVRLGGPDLDTDDPDFREADEACRDELPDGGPRGAAP